MQGQFTQDTQVSLLMLWLPRSQKRLTCLTTCASGEFK
uniref:Uncharacterized protein n=1 Tax=Anguilla anguilla TaxID=7936 RepID=A0A0E9PSX8_ANGAN